MARQSTFALVAGLALAGCCHNGFDYPASPIALAQFHLPSKLHLRKQLNYGIVSRRRVTTKRLPISSGDASEFADEDLKKKLTICRGCEDSPPNNHPNSVWPKSASGNLTVDQVSTLFPNRSISSGGQR
jgi:hypothetical protein